ncbi:ergothioneine biosynthesis glutamate--cysteine ligase EgtA [Rhodococcus sp. SGAir0479]|uniref:ergothioneine biosynthesis glutamate--cysteine ligase EgtA n=1 Tax=Rhodococcus sp. SGAir0479 TaxID=2567884 RepID=UPI0010CD1491|nr:ergothioneine biosynthesis glutamate--cysteine ligase EgtA [Rhodococcus sp. SGAir0479]QCQ90133.1 ergothioneine biosynthesis glutamate--cysteine ligase EgtA [Rhodococcus sp. SGAir0479]
MVVAVESTCFSSRPAAESYVGGVCFKLGPPQLIGAELEWLTAGAGPVPARPELAAVAAALGPHAPRSIVPDSPARPLPAGGLVTVEPGGQIEISSAPHADAAALCEALASDERTLRTLLAAQSITTHAHAADTRRDPRRLLELPRYRAMEERFDGIGPYGRLMMCNTAAVQVSVDAGADTADVARRWNTLHAIGPALVAAFACSPRLYGIPAGEWASQRMRTWLELDPPRTAGPGDELADPVADYARWVLDVPLLCVRRDGPCWTAPPDATFADWIDGALDDELGRRPTEADLDYHLTTVFPPVRAVGHLEVRYLDAQPGDGWRLPVAALDALSRAPGTIDVAAPTRGRWHEAARDGLANDDLRDGAVALLELAAEYTPDPGFAQQLGAAARRCRSRLQPAEGCW